MNISIILPAYNEQENLTFAVESAINHLNTFFSHYEIIIIDDASTDETFKKAAQLQQKYGKDLIKIIQNESNLGQGRSLFRGIQGARFEWITHNGVDCPFDFNDLYGCIKNNQQSDLIVITRENRKAYSFWRRLVSHGFVFLINHFNNSQINDYSFIQIFKRELIPTCLNEKYASTAFLMPSLILNAKKANYNVTSLNRTYHQRKQGVATGASFKNILQGLRDLLSYRFMN